MFTRILLSLSLLLLPGYGKAQQYCYPQVSYVTVLGGLTLGAIAGAFAGSATSSKGKRSGNSSSERFPRDVNNSLTFNFFIPNVNVQPNSTVTYIPFVALPNGTIIEGTSTPISTPGSIMDLNLGSIPVPSAFYGVYTTGVQTIYNGLGTTADLNISVNASRDNSLTLLLNNELIIHDMMNAVVETQTSTNFTYDKNNIP